VSAPAQLLALYDITLVDTLTGEPFQVPSGQAVTVTLSNVKLGGAKSVAVVHVLADGSLEVLPAVVSGSKVTFSASSFSLYGVIGTPPGNSGNTGNNNTGGLMVGTGGTVPAPGWTAGPGLAALVAAFTFTAFGWRRRGLRGTAADEK